MNDPDIVLVVDRDSRNLTEDPILRQWGTAVKNNSDYRVSDVSAWSRRVEGRQDRKRSVGAAISMWLCCNEAACDEREQMSACGTFRPFRVHADTRNRPLSLRCEKICGLRSQLREGPPTREHSLRRKPMSSVVSATLRSSPGANGAR
jgi:hypothetical protein